MERNQASKKLQMRSNYEDYEENNEEPTACGDEQEADRYSDFDTRGRDTSTCVSTTGPAASSASAAIRASVYHSESSLSSPWATAAVATGLATTSTTSTTRNQKQPRPVKRSTPPTKGRIKSSKPDDTRPRRPLTAYNIFFAEQRSLIIEERTQQLLAANADNSQFKLKTKKAKIAFEELAKIIGARWKNLNPSELPHYQNMAQQDKIRYTAEMDAYNNMQEENLSSSSSPPPSSSPCPPTLPLFSSRQSNVTMRQQSQAISSNSTLTHVQEGSSVAESKSQEGRSCQSRRPGRFLSMPARLPSGAFLVAGEEEQDDVFQRQRRTSSASCPESPSTAFLSWASDAACGEKRRHRHDHDHEDDAPTKTKTYAPFVLPSSTNTAELAALAPDRKTTWPASENTQYVSFGKDRLQAGILLENSQRSAILGSNTTAFQAAGAARRVTNLPAQQQQEQEQEQQQQVCQFNEQHPTHYPYSVSRTPGSFHLTSATQYHQHPWSQERSTTRAGAPVVEISGSDSITIPFSASYLLPVQESLLLNQQEDQQRLLPSSHQEHWMAPQQQFGVDDLGGVPQQSRMQHGGDHHRRIYNHDGFRALENRRAPRSDPRDDTSMTTAAFLVDQHHDDGRLQQEDLSWMEPRPLGPAATHGQRRLEEDLEQTKKNSSL
ncbi:hypothetical protein ACA910_010013 [Epithemia clementina (nom. ined.)]